MIAVHQQRPRGLWPDCSVEGQQVDFGVPEDVAEIGVASEGACPYRDAIVLGVGGTSQMVDGGRRSRCRSNRFQLGKLRRICIASEVKWTPILDRRLGGRLPLRFGKRSGDDEEDETED